MTQSNQQPITSFRAIGSRILIVAQAGLVVGAAVGLIILLFSDSKDPTLAGENVAKYLLVLACVLPLTLIYSYMKDNNALGSDLFTSPLQAYSSLIIIGLSGGILGGLFFVVLATNFLAIFGGIDIQPLSEAIRLNINSLHALLVVVLTGAAGLACAIHYQSLFNQ